MENNNNNVCRLCMSDKELVWIFDQRFGNSEKNMKNVVMVTTGVEMLENDIVSQYICTNCCKLTVKMFDFRERALKTDQYLKLQNQCQELRISSEITLKKPNTSGSITMDSVPMKPKFTTVPSTSTSEVGESTEIKTEITKENEVQKRPRINIHPSIQQIFSKYADIKISTGCLKFDVNPVVSMEMNCVEEYFKLRNIDMKNHVHKVLRTMRASKKTSALHPSKNNHENENETDTSKDVNGRVSPINVNKRNLEDDIDSEDYIINKTMKVKRRRLSSSDFTTSPEIIQSTLTETLQLKPTKNILIHRCKLCNVIQVNAKALKKHYRTHFICSYCKSKFRVLERKEKHVETCAFKHALTCSTYVDLETLDLTQYQSKNEENTDKDDIIELSDDENNTISLDNSTPQVPIPKLVPLIRQQPVQHISTALVKPSIKFMDTHVLNGIDVSNPDVKVLKELLTQTGSHNKKLVVDNETQTTVPTNNQIVQSPLYAAAQLKNLLPHLYVYKIPIEIKPGKFNVSYTKNNKNKQKEKKKVVDHWTNTKVIDVTGKHSPNLNMDLNRRLAEGISLFATPTNNSCQQVDQTCNVQSQILPLSGICQSINMPQQVSTTGLHMYNMPRTNQGLFSNLQMQNTPQSKQTLTSNLQMKNMPQTNQVLTSNVPKQFLPTMDQTSSGQIHILPKSVYTSNVQTQNMPHHILLHKLPQQVQTIPPAQNTNQDSQVPSKGNSLTNTYFCQQNRKDLNANSQIINTTNSNTQGFVNITANIPFTQQNMNLSQTPPLLNYTMPANNSVLMNPSMSNFISTSSNSVINRIQLPSSASKTPSPNINYFSSNSGTNRQVANTNTNFNNSISQNVHKPQIRVRNLCELK